MFELSFDPYRLLAALPRRRINMLPAGTAVPRRRGLKVVGNPYNGFDAGERSRTHQVSKWLVSKGAMDPGRTCDICVGPTTLSHAEDYFDLSTWIDMCLGCHARLHKRFGRLTGWIEHLNRHGVPSEHWTRLVSPEPFDLAGLLRQRGVTEPVYEAFVETQHS
jgi:hypothetical protein